MRKTGELGKKILEYAVLGGAAYISLSNPKFVKYLGKTLIRKIGKYNLERSLKSLKENKLISLSETEDGFEVKATKNGKSYVQKFDLDNLEIPEPQKWDKKWRLVIFDIPEFNKKERDFFAKKLKEIGFCAIQDSVFIFPYECEKEIDFLSELCGVRRYVQYGILTSISNQDLLVKHFNIL